jgi:hypothetical protein
MEHPMPDADIEPKPANQDALVADIERTREELAQTIDAISDRLNPANAARRSLDRARQRVAQVDPVLAGGVAVAIVGATVAYVVFRRRKH